MKLPIPGKIEILLADGDSALAQVVSQSLRELGFNNIQHVRDAERALDVINTQKIDLLITEWGMRGMTGIDLVSKLRRDPNSRDPMLPIMMLTGRGEIADVTEARDAGITEFIVKPFMVRTLYNRVEQLVDNPREFVVSQSYVGPTRRRRQGAPKGGERRGARPQTLHSSESAAALSTGKPAIIMPSFSLKTAMGLNGPLASVITPQMLEKAQQTINDMHSSSLQWIKEDIEKLEAAHLANLTGPQPNTMAAMKEATLSIKSRAGTFGFTLASEIARLLFLFLAVDYRKWKDSHTTIMQQHIDAMKIAIGQTLRTEDTMGRELLTELERLRYTLQ